MHDSLSNTIIETNSELSFSDYLGTLMVRCKINRNHHTVSPGLYKIGSPEKNSPVFISANYKLSFDHLRKALNGFSAWILVIDTNGINVWCSASKGTFSEDEILKKINEFNLKDIVPQGMLILPQLSLTGVCSYKLQKKSGYKVIIGPVRANDIPLFIKNKMTASSEMRNVTFNIIERIILTPVEIVHYLIPMFFLLIFFIFLSGFNNNPYNLRLIFFHLPKTLIFLSSAYLSGTLLFPILIPLLPGRSFSFKGLILGGIVMTMFYALNFPCHINNFDKIFWMFIFTSISSFLSMNFTGSAPFTSISGVKKEMKIFLPIQITLFSLGTLMYAVSNFFTNIKLS